MQTSTMQVPLGARPAISEADFDAAQGMLEGLPYPVMLIGDDFEIRFANWEARRHYGDRAHCHELCHGLDTPCSTDDSLCPKLVAERTGRVTTSSHVHKTDRGPVEVLVCAVPLETGEVVALHFPAVRDASTSPRRLYWWGIALSAVALVVLIPGIFLGVFSGLFAAATVVIGSVALALALDGHKAARRGVGATGSVVVKGLSFGMSATATTAGVLVLASAALILLRGLL